MKMSSGRKKKNKCLEGNKRELDHGKMCSFESSLCLDLRDHMVTHRAFVRCLHNGCFSSPPGTPPPPSPQPGPRVPLDAGLRFVLLVKG